MGIAEVMQECSIAKSPNQKGVLPGNASSGMTVIEPRSGWRLIDFREIWRYRDLFLILSWRDIQIRYKQTVLGALWALIQPLATMVPFVLFLGNSLGANPNPYPYSLFVFAGLVPWFLFSNIISSAAQSVVGNQSLVTKVYFPRLLIPLASIGPHVLDFAIGLCSLLVMMLAFGILPGWRMPLVPLLLTGIAIAALGVGTLLAALTVAYRDFRYVVPFLVQLWMFATPCVFIWPSKSMGSLLEALLPLNPAYGLILNFRTALLGGESNWYALLVSGGVAIVSLVLGCFYFRQVERGFADVI